MTRGVIHFLFFICSITFSFVKIESAEIIYLIPFPGFETNERLFDLTDRDECCKPFFDLKKSMATHGYLLHLSSIANLPTGGKKVIVFDVPSEQDLFILSQKYKKEQCVLMIWEPPVVKPQNYHTKYHLYFDKILTTVDELIDSKRYYKFYYPQPNLGMIDNIIPFNCKKLCTLIAGNKQSNHASELYSERLKTINFFEAKYPHDFEFYGIGWSNHYKTYKGTIKTKKDILKNYKFCICYENTRNLEGYITEKIFDCFIAGCVPIYWGSKNINYYIQSNCFLDREQFSSNEELYAYIKEMTEECYEQYLINIANFLKSNQVKFFSIENFIDILTFHITN